MPKEPCICKGNIVQLFTTLAMVLKIHEQRVLKIHEQRVLKIHEQRHYKKLFFSMDSTEVKVQRAPFAVNAI